jgi:hypothetical protein
MGIAKKWEYDETHLRFEPILIGWFEVVKSGNYIISYYDIGYNIKPYKMKSKMDNLD